MDFQLLLLVFVNYVPQFIYMLHVVNDVLNNDDDIKRVINNVFVHANMFISKFYKCLTYVKLLLFKSYSMMCHFGNISLSLC